MIVKIRKNAGIIAGFMAAAMAITLFVGVFYSGKSGNLGPQISTETAVGTIGTIAISYEKYAETLNSLAVRYGINASQKQDPEEVEAIQYAAFEQALQQAIILDFAQKAEIKPNSQDIDSTLQQILVQYDLKDVDALKTKLKEAQIDWDHFEAGIEDSVKMQLIANFLQRSTKVTDQDIENQGTSVNVQHIFIRANTYDKDALAAAEARIQSIYKKVQGGTSFTQLAQAYSEDPNSKEKGGDLGWIGANTTVPEFNAAIFALSIGEISKPFHTPFGYHIVKITDKKGTPTFAGINNSTEKTKLLESKQRQAVSVFLRQYISLEKLRINDPNVKAYYAKNTGDLPGAIGAYNAQISRSTYDPRPHYLLAKIYKTIGNQSDYIAELKKSVLKGSLSPQLDVPMARVMYADYLREIGNRASSNIEYDKALESSKGHLKIMQRLETQLKTSGEIARATAIETERKKLEAMIQQQAAARQPNRQPISGGLKL